MTEKAQIVHSNGARDPVAIVSNKVIGTLLAVFILATLGSIAAVGVLNFRVGILEDKLDNLAEKIENGMDARWRRSDHDAYAQRVDDRLRTIELRPFPFTEQKSESLTRAVLEIANLKDRLSECEAKIKEHEQGQKHEDK